MPPDFTDPSPPPVGETTLLLCKRIFYRDCLLTGLHLPCYTISYI